MRNLALSQLDETMSRRLPARENLAKTWSGCSRGVSPGMTSCRRIGGTRYLGGAENKRVRDTQAGFSATCTNVWCVHVDFAGSNTGYAVLQPGYCRKCGFLTCGRKGPGSLDLQRP